MGLPKRSSLRAVTTVEQPPAVVVWAEVVKDNRLAGKAP